MLINVHHLNNANQKFVPVAVASFTRQYYNYTYKSKKLQGLKILYKTTHAKKVEYSAACSLRLCARCSIFKLHFSYLLNMKASYGPVYMFSCRLGIQMLVNPFIRIAPYLVLYYFTLSNARTFYLSRGELWCLMG